MKRTFLKTIQSWISLLSVLLVLFCWQSAVFANTDEKSAEIIPTTIPAVWQAVDNHVATMNDAIQNNQLDQIHHHAFAIDDLVKSLPALSKDLSDEKLTALKKQIAYVDELSKRLDKTGDAKDKAGTIANLEKLQKILNVIRANYSLSGKENLN